MSITRALQRRRQRRVWRVRNQIRKVANGRLRLSVFRSNKHISAQVIDDSTGTTVVSASSTEKELASGLKNGGNVAAAMVVGKKLGERCVQKGIAEVVFDRGQYKYHGRIAALADGAREAGLQF
jgi:large subunit ribosomal protein L18